MAQLWHKTPLPYCCWKVFEDDGDGDEDEEEESKIL